MTYSCEDKDINNIPFSDWETPGFVIIKKKTKRINPDLEKKLKIKALCHFEF
ncbi:MAG: hypothetical protein ACM3XP_06195 [Nitrososphaerales archaeon]